MRLQLPHLPMHRADVVRLGHLADEEGNHVHAVN